jgi:hypothetical protein
MSNVKKQGRAFAVAALFAMLSTGSVFAADLDMDQIPANPGDVISYGPGGGEGGGDTGVDCYWVKKDIYKHADNVIRVGETVYYRIFAKALCNMKRPRLTDYLPRGLDVTYVSPGCHYNPGHGKVTCEGLTAPAGATATVYIGVRACNPAHRWVFNNACFTSHLGGYMCHGIWTWIRRAAPEATPAPAPVPPIGDRPEEQLPDDNGFFPEHPLY